ncbi:MAG TPA: acyl-CoA dehydrogenase family protein [Longimicrobiales bacterium]|nr:acyl-CoA dehydrogenase family protein [Longimicrobiales bacterium]
MPDTRPIRAFLDDRHLALADRLAAFCDASVRPLPSPADDVAARVQARELLRLLGAERLFELFDPPDLRGASFAREALAAASPLADAVFAVQGLGATPIRLGASDVARRDWLGKLVRGEAMAAFAMTEPEAGSDVAAIATTARRDGDEWVLDGYKTLISNAGIADVYSVFATTDPDRGRKGIGCFLVPADAPGLRFARPLVMSAPHPLGDLALEGARIPAAYRLDAPRDGEGGGFRLGLATLDRLRPTVGAAACGMASRALEEALAHATSRRQFGRPIADLEAIRAKLATMAIDLTAARLLVYRAAREGDLGAERITIEAAMAKAFATEAAQRIVDGAVQVLGGRGVLADHPVDRLYRAVRALRIYEGTTEVQLAIIGAALVAAAGRTGP